MAQLDDHSWRYAKDGLVFGSSLIAPDSETHHLPHIGFDDKLGLRKYSAFLIKGLNTMQSISHITVLNQSPNMQAIICKLPAYLSAE